MPSIYALTDLMLLPSAGDTYDFIVDEAQARCLPVVSTSVPAEILTIPRWQDKLSGTTRNSGAMVDYTERFVSNSQPVCATGKTARGRVLANDHPLRAVDVESSLDDFLRR